MPLFGAPAATATSQRDLMAVDRANRTHTSALTPMPKKDLPKGDKTMEAKAPAMLVERVERIEKLPVDGVDGPGTFTLLREADQLTRFLPRKDWRASAPIVQCLPRLRDILIARRTKHQSITVKPNYNRHGGATNDTRGPPALGHDDLVVLAARLVAQVSFFAPLKMDVVNCPMLLEELAGIMWGGYSEGARLSMVTMMNLSYSRKTAVKLCERGMLDLVIAGVRTTRDPRVLPGLTTMLMRFTFHAPCLPLLVERHAAQALQPLLDMDGQSSGPEHAALFDYVQWQASVSVSNLLAGEEKTPAITRNVLTRVSHMLGIKSRNTGARFGGLWYSVEQLCVCVGNLGSADSNKQVLIEEGAVEALMRVLSLTKEKSRDSGNLITAKSAAMRALWTFSFGAEGSAAIRKLGGESAIELFLKEVDAEEKDWKEAQKSGGAVAKHASGAAEDAGSGEGGGSGNADATSDDPDTEPLTADDFEMCRKHANGVLFQLEQSGGGTGGGGKRASKKSASRTATSTLPLAPSESAAEELRVMLSYSWNQQSTVLALAQALRERNPRISVLVDVEFMTGDVLEKMGQAVESAHVVVVALSRSYQISPNCRTEASYAFQLRKPIVPILVEDFRPSGWLGALVGMRLYVDFSRGLDDVHSRSVDLEREILSMSGLSPTSAVVASAGAGAGAAAVSQKNGGSGEGRHKTLAGAGDASSQLGEILAIVRSLQAEIADLKAARG